MSSNLNRRGVPTTNVFSVEGSNPVMNNQMKKSMFDEESIQSDDSDMIGFEDHPDFVKEGINGNGQVQQSSGEEKIIIIDKYSLPGECERRQDRTEHQKPHGKRGQQGLRQR